ncbi:unnamed protein product, partial [Gongylonema pulchrum]|uniref:Uncharacterized protein n=1 Tax=Gongylonema pulchrum TaxID=637853 RepID=A0A183DJK0_9BILA
MNNQVHHGQIGPQVIRMHLVRQVPRPFVNNQPSPLDQVDARLQPIYTDLQQKHVNLNQNTIRITIQ